MIAFFFFSGGGGVQVKVVVVKVVVVREPRDEQKILDKIYNQELVTWSACIYVSQ